MFVECATFTIGNFSDKFLIFSNETIPSPPDEKFLKIL